MSGDPRSFKTLQTGFATVSRGDAAGLKAKFETLANSSQKTNPNSSPTQQKPPPGGNRKSVTGASPSPQRSIAYEGGSDLERSGHKSLKQLMVEEKKKRTSATYQSRNARIWLFLWN